MQEQAKLEIKLIRANIINAFVKVIVHGCYPFSMIDNSAHYLLIFQPII